MVCFLFGYLCRVGAYVTIRPELWDRATGNSCPRSLSSIPVIELLY